MPFFSIIIPTYNRGDFICSTIQSLLNQDFGDFEIIIIDDGSTDNTEHKIITNFTQNNKIRYFKKENTERGAARNYGFKKAEGEYVIFFDSDDIMHPNHLRALLSIIKKEPHAYFLATKYKLLRHNKCSLPLSGIKEGWYDYRFFLKGNALAINFCLKKNNPTLCMFQEDRKYATMEDWIFLLQNLQKNNIYISDNVTVTLNDHDDRSMRCNNKNIIQKKILATLWIHANLKLSEKEVQVLDGYSNYFCAVHSYADSIRSMAISYLLNAIKKVGIKKSFIILAIKIAAGYNFIQKLK